MGQTRAATHRQRKRSKRLMRVARATVERKEVDSRLPKIARIVLLQRAARTGVIDTRVISTAYWDCKVCGWNPDDETIWEWWWKLWPNQRRKLVELSQEGQHIEREIRVKKAPDYRGAVRKF